MKHSILLFVISLLTTPVLAMEQNELTITATGAQAPSGGYFRIAENLLVNCKYNVIYFDISSDFGKAAYSTLLAAKASGKKLSRISYTQDPGSERCNLDLLESH